MPKVPILMLRYSHKAQRVSSGSPARPEWGGSSCLSVCLSVSLPVRFLSCMHANARPTTYAVSWNKKRGRREEPRTLTYHSH